MATVTLSTDDFTTLAAWAENYGLASDAYAAIRAMVERIETANGMVRRFLMVRWRDATAPHSGVAFADWPPQYTTTLLRYDTPWTYEEVMAAVDARTSQPVGVEVTEDRTGTVGWYDITTFFGR